jgi:DNA-binding response OmpR family regulator
MVSTNRAVRALQKQILQLDNSIAESFARLKKDLAKQAAEIEAIKSIIRKHEEVIVQFQNRQTPKDTKPTQHHTTQLSPLHFHILKRLMILQMESKRRTISLRELAAELYPNKAYDTTKATLSEYVARLHKQGLVEKVYAGKLYLSYTEKALQYADSQRINLMRSLISIPAKSSY